jgi:copper chaperone CopZ
MATPQNDTIYIPLEEVDSEHCAMIVDRELDKIEGITSHKVELNNHRAVIQSSDPQPTIGRAVKAIREIGYDVPTIKKTYPVLNMSCASCASSSQSILESQPGVINVAVNYANGQAQIEFVPGITGPEKLKAALQAIGYDLMIDEKEEAKDALADLERTRYKSLRNRTIWAIILSIPVVVIGMFFNTIAYSHYIMAVLSFPVVAVFGRQFCQHGHAGGLKHGYRLSLQPFQHPFPTGSAATGPPGGSIFRGSLGGHRLYPVREAAGRTGQGKCFFSHKKINRPSTQNRDHRARGRAPDGNPDLESTTRQYPSRETGGKDRRGWHRGFRFFFRG